MESETYYYGLLATSACIICLFSDDENFDASVGATWILSFFWAGSTFLWMTDSIKYFVLTDSLFAGLTLAMFFAMRLRWLAILALLYFGNVILDVMLLRKILVYGDFAVYSNWLFRAELLIACHRGIIGILKRIGSMVTFLYRKVTG